MKCLAILLRLRRILPAAVVVLFLNAITSQANDYPHNNDHGIVLPLLQERPVIGVYTEPTSHHPKQLHYVAASYVKWLESVGARSVPIPQNADRSTIESIFRQINGVLFTGGASLTLPDSLGILWELAVAANDDGNVFPIWGTCLGFERLVSLVSGEGASIFRSDYDAENLTLALDFDETEGNVTSVLFRDPRVKHIAAHRPVTSNAHRNGIPPPTFVANANLHATFRIVSTNRDRHGMEFVSTIEAREYPFYAVQWHPEKNNFEYGSTVTNGKDVPNQAIDHSEDAVELSIAMASIFVHEARKNNHEYTGEYPLMWNYPVKKDNYFEQVYYVDITKWKNYHRRENSRYGSLVFFLVFPCFCAITCVVMQKITIRSKNNRFSPSLLSSEDDFRYHLPEDSISSASFSD